MLTATEIYDNLDKLVADPPEGGEFGLALMEAVGAPRTTITKLRDQAATGSFAWTRMLKFEAVALYHTDAALDRLREEAENTARSRRPRILVAYDGQNVAVFDTKLQDEPTRVSLDGLAIEGDMFFPLGGHERYVPPKEKLADVRATKLISRFHDAVKDANPDWTTTEHRHALNLFMARVLFCLFSDDVGIFDRDVFETALRTTKPDGGDLRDFLEGAFDHMNTPPEKRSTSTRPWSKMSYVNGGLFQEASDMPLLDGKCRKQLLDCARLNWRTINPDIFGSMLQAVVDIEKRGDLGMHYTSPANIMKVLGPILIDPLKVELESAGTNKTKLRSLLVRLGQVRVFDPACGSGNFLIIAYKELRALEMEILRRLGAQPHPVVELEQFYGIEIDDFACQAARLGLWIAEYQVSEQFRLNLGHAEDFLPLSEAGRIVCDNAARRNWLDVCPPDDTKETYVVGNPQFKGSKTQSSAQKADAKIAYKGHVPKAGELDYVGIWFLKGALYCEETGAPFALVSTNSIVQGSSVPTIWPRLLKHLEIQFAHRSFKWSNLATNKAAVTCVIVGMGRRSNGKKKLFDGDSVREVNLIGPYLAPNVPTIVKKRSTKPLAPDFERMDFGNMPLDGRNEKCLRMSRDDRQKIVAEHPGAEVFIRPIFGSDELLKGKDLWCIWVRPEKVEVAYTIEPLRRRFEIAEAVRTSKDAGEDMRKAGASPWSFREQREAHSHTIMIPGAASLERDWLPIDIKDAKCIVSNLAFGIFDGEVWQAAVLSSRMHRLWLETVGGRLKEDPRYSNTLVWNTFPLPKLSDRRKMDLEEHWWEIDLARKEAGFGRSLGELYARKSMPKPLRRAHEELDETMETILGSRRYRSDADRIEHLLHLYERMVDVETEEQIKNDSSKTTKSEETS